MDKKIRMACLTALEYSEKQTVDSIFDLDKKGIDLIELLVPFSDPVAENPEIQDASLRALKNGCTIEKIFTMLDGIKGKIDAKILLSFYANTAYRYGYNRFSERAAKAGVYGLIAEDMPFEEKKEMEPAAEANGLFVVNIIASKNSKRIKEIAQDAKELICISPSLTMSTDRGEFQHILEIIKDNTGVPVLTLDNKADNENSRYLVSI